MWEHGDHMTGFGWAVMGTFMLLLLGVLVTVAVLIGHAAFREHRCDRDSGSAESPEQVLAHRFVNGDLDLLEYQERLDALHGGRVKQPSPPAGQI